MVDITAVLAAGKSIRAIIQIKIQIARYFPPLNSLQALLDDFANRVFQFGADSVQDAASLNISSANQVPRRPPLHTSLAVAAVKSARERSITYADYSLSGTAALNKESPHTSSTQEDSRSHSHRQNRSATSDWESRIADPKCEKDINAQLEELAEDAPLWLLLARVCSYTRDGGALMHAVVAEELAEWSAHLASDQTMASKLAPEQNDSEEEWGPRVDRRADYWSEVSIVWKRLHSEDKEASEQLATQVKRWLNQQDRQLQAEQAQLQALTEEVEEIKRQVVQSQKWRESQFEVQNRVLQAEVNALKQSIIDNTRRIKDLKVNQRDPNTSVGSPLPEDKHRMSISQDSLNTSNF